MMQSLNSLLLRVSTSCINNVIRSSSSGKKYVPFDYSVEPRKFEAKFHSKGPLPRLRDDNRPVAQTIIYEPHEWHPREATFGQNDYIDIMGNDNIHPTRCLDRVPPWLRGFNDNEIALIQRKRQANPHWEWTKPQKWLKMKKRLHWLYQRMNKKWQPPPITQF